MNTSRSDAPSGLRTEVRVAEVTGPMRTLRRVLLGSAAVLLFALASVGTSVAWNVSAFDASMSKVYAVPLTYVAHSSDPAVLARGKHLVEASAACASASCHGGDLGGGVTVTLGPMGFFTGPNITPAGVSASYSDAELARLLRHGVKADGRSVRFMPVEDFGWLPDDDIAAIVSYLRVVPPSARPNGTTAFTTFAKVLDRMGGITIDVARRIAHQATEHVPPPGPSAEYGQFLARACVGCHGEHLSGGRLPGAPASLPVPLNLTPDVTGLSGWTYEDFDRLFANGIRKNGAKLDPFMPLDAFGKLDNIEKQALWAYLATLPPRRFGGR